MAEENPYSYKTISENPEECGYSYGQVPSSDTALIPPSLYKQIIRHLPILCVDVFIINEEDETYFLVYRTNHPARDMWWPLGGRVKLFESFFQAAQRKALKEAGLIIEPFAILKTQNLMFEDSEWGGPTHTPAIGVAALYVSSAPKLDKDHGAYQWAPLAKPHPVNYVELLRQRALKKLAKLRRCKT